MLAAVQDRQGFAPDLFQGVHPGQEADIAIDQGRARLRQARRLFPVRKGAIVLRHQGRRHGGILFIGGDIIKLGRQGGFHIRKHAAAQVQIPRRFIREEAIRQGEHDLRPLPPGLQAAAAADMAVKAGDREIRNPGDIGHGLGKIRRIQAEAGDKGLAEIQVHPEADGELPIRVAAGKVRDKGYLGKVIRVHHGAGEQGRGDLPHLVRPVEDDPLRRKAEAAGQLIFHGRDHLRVPAEGADQGTDVGRIVRLKGIGKAVFRIGRAHSGDEAGRVGQKGGLIEEIEGTAVFPLQGIRFGQGQVHHSSICFPKPISIRRTSKASAYFFPIS